MITIKIAELPIGIENRFEYTKDMSLDYLTDDKPIFTVTPTEEDIKRERSLGESDFSDEYFERLVAYRHIAEVMPAYDGFLFHGSVIELSGKAYIFTANSGVGKTTHTRLWLSEFPNDVSIINGDKPIIRFIDGIPCACGTPWQGKENYGKNVIKPIGGVAFLSRGTENRAYPITADEAVMRFMSQIYLPKRSPAMLSATLRLADKMLKSVNLVHLECNMEPEAAHVCRKALLKTDKTW